jgi:toxin ParE1/3/4
MSLTLCWTPAARADLLDIWTWRGREHPETGDAVLDRIEAACNRLCKFPMLGVAVPTIAPEARKLSVDNYLALYRITPDAIEIVRVLDQRRLIESEGFGG